MSYVYVIAGGRRHIKIGISHAPKERLKGIQTGCPFTLRIAKTWNTSRAREIEKKAHTVLHKYRWAGEWFDVPHQTAVLVVDMLVKAMPCRGAQDIPINKAVLFCRECGHTGMLQFVPGIAARFRCSKCQSRDHAHVIDVIMNQTKRASPIAF